MMQLPQLPLTCALQGAVAAYWRAVDAQVHAWPGVQDALAQALQEAPDFALAHALHALVLGAWGKGPEARDAAARACVLAAHATPREVAHCAIVALIVSGRSNDALTAVLHHAKAHPDDALMMATAMGAYGLFAFSGRADHNEARLVFLDTLMPHYAADLPWLLANRGWARIELGRVEEGLAMAQTAIHMRPDNGHNAHIVMHGFFEATEPQAALDFAERWLPSYPGNGFLWGHIHWHAALAEIDLDQPALAMQRLMGPILDYLPRGAPFMGLADIASLPWRLSQRGQSGLPWAVAQQHIDNHFSKGANVFGELHLAMVAAACRDRSALVASGERLDALANGGHEGAPVAGQWVVGLLALFDSEREQAQTQARTQARTQAQAAMDACAAGAVRLGGSHAQRSVIEATRRALHLPSID